MAGFSERHNYQVVGQPIRYREDASPNLRRMVVDLAEAQKVSPSTLRSIICRELLVAPDQSNWTEFPNIDGECRMLMERCDWVEVYDIIEKIWQELSFQAGIRYDLEATRTFEKDINKLFFKDGAGWQIIDGEILARGSEPFNRITQTARETLADRNQTAASEIHEAVQDISRRPHPDKTGAVHHAMGAVECVARSLTGSSTATLGDIIKHKANQLGIPAPLDQAISKMWGYASERGRHIREGHEPTFEEAELIVTVASAVCTYLSRRVS